MIDRSDYCSGASAASSHMVHGGIRYLENGEFRLVREAVQERNSLIENAPHLVKPLPTTFPIFKWFSGLLNAPLKFWGLLERPAERGAIVIKLGMLLYDWYTRKQKTVPKHVFRNRQESLAHFPAINPDVLFTGTYYDGAMPSPEQIAIELLLDVIEASVDAIPLNYVRLVSAEKDTVIVQDEISGEQIELKPKVLVNAAGPWIDFVNQDMGICSNFISGTKGSHLILDHPELRQAIGNNEFFFENKDGRIVLIFPIKDKVMIGTSDIRIDHPDDAIVTNEEVQYFFKMIQRVFPGIQLDTSQIVYTFSGVRPLQQTEGAPTGQISRDHIVQITKATKSFDIPVYSLVGGKWTSFRAFSEHAANEILAYLGIERKISTKNLQIGGSKAYPIGEEETQAYLSRLAKTYTIKTHRAAELFETYGTKTQQILEQQGALVSQKLSTIQELSVGEINYLAASQDILHLDDLILRRTMLCKLGKISPASLDEIAQICARQLNWSKQKTRQEKDRFVELLRKAHKMDFNSYIEA
jgi:glycerol-3-phosphate dehydrogenase